MERLWAPWRSQYVKEAPPPSESAGACFLCRGLAESNDRSNLLVSRGQASAVFLNKYPYNNGHLLVAPLVHKGCLTELQGDELHEPLEMVKQAVSALKTILNPHAFNVGLNLGRSAGAGLPGHLHWHIVPRWDGDTNFMPVLSGTKVIVESLEEFYDRLVPELASIRQR